MLLPMPLQHGAMDYLHGQHQASYSSTCKKRQTSILAKPFTCALNTDLRIQGIIAT
jgi:hypothetical protein